MTTVALVLTAAAALGAHAVPLPLPPTTTRRCPTTPLPPGRHELAIEFDGRNRTALLYVPEGYDLTAPLDVVTLFHGLGDDPDIMARHTFTQLSQTEGFLLLAPRGLDPDLSWAGGACCGEANRLGLDDVGLFRALLEELRRVACVADVFVTGYSTGGYLALRVGCEASDLIQGVGAVAGQLSPASSFPCEPSVQLPIAQFHGRVDLWVGYAGGLAGIERMANEVYECASGAPTTSFTNNTATCERFCDTPVVEFCTLSRQGHDWPGATCDTGHDASGCGIPSYDVNASARSLALWRGELK